jgi:hypothetical protein
MNPPPPRLRRASRRDILRSLIAMPVSARLARAQAGSGAAWTATPAFEALRSRLGKRLVAVSSPLEA